VVYVMYVNVVVHFVCLLVPWCSFVTPCTLFARLWTRLLAVLFNRGDVDMMIAKNKPGHTF
jgi:hypothetical protein